MDSEEILRLLQIANLAKDWPALRPIHDRAMEKLVEAAKNPAHQPAPAPAPKPVGLSGFSRKE